MWKNLNTIGGMDTMFINLALLSIAMDEMTDANKPCLTIRLIECWWDGIGEWTA